MAARLLSRGSFLVMAVYHQAGDLQVVVGSRVAPAVAVKLAKRKTYGLK